jgi:hypothetical protein
VDKPSILRIIFFFGTVFIWFPTLVFGALNHDKHYFYFSNLITGYLYLMNKNIGTFILTAIIFILFLTIFNKKLSFYMYIAILCDATSLSLIMLFGRGVFWNSNGMSFINGNSAINFFEPIFYIKGLKKFIDSIAKGDVFVTGKLLLLYFGLGLGVVLLICWWEYIEFFKRKSNKGIQ